MDYSNNWYMNAYGILSHSSSESGAIPLSELVCYRDNFGVIGSFEEFVVIIYAMNDCYSANRKKKLESSEQTVPKEVT